MLPEQRQHSIIPMARKNRLRASAKAHAKHNGVAGLVAVLASLLIGSVALSQSRPGTQPKPDSEPNGTTAIENEGGAATIEQLEDETWQLQEYLTPAGLKPVVSDTGNRYAEFRDGRFRLNSGCNTLNGRYWLQDSRLLFSSHVTSLLLDCPDTLMRQERALLGLLAKVERFGLRDGSMALMDAQGRVLLTLGRPDALPLQGRVWRLQAYRNYADMVVMAVDDPPFTISFENAANLSGNACETYRALYTRDAHSLHLIGPIAASRGGCPGSPAASRQSADYIAALSIVDSYRVDAKALLLRDKDGRMLASFAALDEHIQAGYRTLNRITDHGDPKHRPDLLPPAPRR